MDSLELVRKLYEDGTDLDALRTELDEGSRQELDHLIEARDALTGLPRRKPGKNIVDAVVAAAVHGRAEAKPPLVLLFTGRTLHRLAAAAIVVVAVGVGYLTLRNDGVVPIEREQIAASTPESPQPAASNEARVAAKTEASEEVLAEDFDADVAEPLQRGVAEMAAGQATRGGATAGRDLGNARRSDELMLADAKVDAVDSVSGKERAERREPLAWDDEEQALRTLFWQMRALDGRSPDDKWEEAVPLEGSFERLEKQQPDSERWLQTGTQR